MRREEDPDLLTTFSLWSLKGNFANNSKFWGKSVYTYLYPITHSFPNKWIIIGSCYQRVLQKQCWLCSAFLLLMTFWTQAQRNLLLQSPCCGQTPQQMQPGLSSVLPSLSDTQWRAESAPLCGLILLKEEAAVFWSQATHHPLQPNFSSNKAGMIICLIPWVDFSIRNN